MNKDNAKQQLHFCERGRGMRRSRKGLLMAIGLILVTLPAVAALAATKLTGIDYASNENGDVTISMYTFGDVPEVGVFATESPARIVLDLSDTENDAGTDAVPVGIGSVQNFFAAGSDGRTRIIVDLSRPSAYDYSTEGGTVTLTISSGNSYTGDRSAPSYQGDSHSLTGVDFRRGDNGQGRVIVNLDSPGANISVEEGPQSLIVDIFNTELPDRLNQRIDVMDFATPVQLIDADARNNGVRMTLAISGIFEHLVYQSGTDIIIEVNEPDLLAAAEEQMQLRMFEDREYVGTKVTFNFQNIPVRSVLALIADVSDLNIVVSDSVSGNLTLRLTNVPWDQALDIVMDARNLDQRTNGNVIWIGPTSEIAAREQELLQARLDREILEPLQTVLIPVNYAKAADLANLIESTGDELDAEFGLLSERGSVSYDTRTNTLLLTDTAATVIELREIIIELDKAVRQVQIESRIVIASSDFAHELGVRFGVTYLHDGSNVGVIAADGRAADIANPYIGTGGPIPDFGRQIAGYPGRYNVNLPAPNSNAGTLGLSFLTGDLLLDLELSALESEGEGEVISTPRVVTANQAEAFIQQGVEIPYENSTSSGATAVQFKDAVLELKATPLITPDNRVQLDLAIKQDTVGEIFQTSRGGSVPSIDTREINTTVLVANGDTVVLGGIFQDENKSNEEKVPWLGDIPWVGALFRRRANESSKRELLIFVTPTIVEERPAL
jgi:type IV pilus assembly protein PilQ